MWKIKQWTFMVVGAFTLIVHLIGCGSSSGGEGAASSQSVLGQKFPVAENANFKTAGINQSFICIDDVDKSYYALNFLPQGTITDDNGLNLSYRLNQNRLEIDFPAGANGPVSYQHGYHMTAGDLVVGFTGTLSDSSSSMTVACIASNHPYSDAVPDTTTITCRSSSVSDRGTSFNSSTTNRFTLEPGHYAQRYFSSRSYESSYSADGSFSVSTYDNFYQHGTYLYDAQAGEFVMGFLKIDFNAPSIDLLVFYGETDGNTVSLSLKNQNRGCAFQ